MRIWGRVSFLRKQGILLSRNFRVELGLTKKKIHCFDLGETQGRGIIVECKDLL